MGESINLLLWLAVIGMVAICAVGSFAVYLFAASASTEAIAATLFVLGFMSLLSWIYQKRIRQ